MQQYCMTRDVLVEEIENAGRFIAGHADDLLGDDLSGMMALNLTVTIELDSVTTVRLNRDYVMAGRHAK